MTYEEHKELIGKYKAQGILQFIKLFETYKDKRVEKLHWGEEIEYHLYSIKQN